MNAKKATKPKAIKKIIEAKSKTVNNVDTEEVSEDTNAFEDTDQLTEVDAVDLNVVATETKKNKEKVLEVLPEDLKDKELNTLAIELYSKISNNIFDFARILYFIRANQEFEKWGYGTFSEYLEKDFKLSERTAYHYLSVHEFLSKQPKENLEKVKSLGYTKIRDLIKVIPAEDHARINQIVDDGKNQTTQEFQKLLQEVRNDNKKTDNDKAIKEGTVDKKTNVGLQFYTEQYDVFNKAVTAAQKISGSKVVTNNVHQICLAFLADLDLQENPRKNIIETLEKYEKMAGVKIICVDKESNKVLMGQQYLDTEANNDNGTTAEH